MNIITVVAVGFGAFVLLMTGIFFFFNKTKGSGKKYPFLLYNRKGGVREIFGKVVVDKENRTRKVFVFEDYDTVLQIKNPTLTVNKVDYRQVTLGDRGELVYLDGFRIDENNYLSGNMTPEDIAVLTSGIQENNKEFENPMAKTTAALLIGMAIIALLIMVGNVYATITLVGNSKDMAAIAKENSKTVSGLQSVAETNAGVMEQAAMILAALTEGANITRRLE